MWGPVVFVIADNWFIEDIFPDMALLELHNSFVAEIYAL
jgi:hypothetical protein